MYLTVTLSSPKGKEIKLPIQYNYYVQGMIYDLLDDKMANFIHKQGFESGNRQFRMFCFSRLIGDYKIDKGNNEIIFNKEIELYISSPMKSFLTQLSNSFLLNESVRLGKEELIIKKVDIGRNILDKNRISVRALSPITVYSTLYKPDGSKYTCYFGPRDKEFGELIYKNVLKKYNAYFHDEPKNKDFSIIPVGKTKLHVVTYKGFVIKGYSGKFIIEGDLGLLEHALNTGLGSKNSQGFGYIKLLD